MKNVTFSGSEVNILTTHDLSLIERITGDNMHGKSSRIQKRKYAQKCSIKQ